MTVSMSCSAASLRRFFAAVLFLGALAIAGAVQAGDMPAAEALFGQARELLSQDRLGEACNKFAESQKLDPSCGTLLNLADCHARQGKTATAWAEFLAAAQLARAQNRRNVEEEATRRAADLEKALSHVTVKVPVGVPGLQVRRTDVLLEAGGIDAKLPVDPGDWTISASAPGYRPWSTKVSVRGDGDSQVVTVPLLEKDASKDEDHPPRVDASHGKPGEQLAATSGARTLGYVFGAGGIALIGVGGAFGVLALNAYKDADAACPLHDGCKQPALDRRSSAERYANVANVCIGVGLLGVGAGAILLFAAPGRRIEPASVAVGANVAHSEMGLSVSGRFR